MDLPSDATDNPGLSKLEALAAADGATKVPEFNFVESIGPS